MCKANDQSSAPIFERAEQELAAFVSAAESAGGSAAANAGNLWITAMEDLDWAADDFETFFRKVTARAASQLAAMIAASQKRQNHTSTLTPSLRAPVLAWQA